MTNRHVYISYDPFKPYKLSKKSKHPQAVTRLRCTASVPPETVPISSTTLPGHKKWAFTIVDNRREQADYMLVFSDWLKRGAIVHCRYAEQNKHGYTHYHGIVSIPNNMMRKHLIPSGYSARFVHMHDEKGWMEYCLKSQPKAYDPFLPDTNDNALIDRLKKPLFK